MERALELPFDQYQRYRLAADLLDRLRNGGKAHTVLDVGGRTALLRSFLGRDSITLVDVEPSEENGLVVGDGCRLPFRDRSFDVVAAFDTLEHVPVERRESFVRECARVARNWVLLVGPYDSPRNVEAEELLRDFLAKRLNFRQKHLEEHREHGLPSRAETERWLAESGARVQSFGHANLGRWLAMMMLSMYLDREPALRDLALSVHRFYNGTLYPSDHAEPVYRHVVLGALNGKPIPDLAGLLDDPVAPQGSVTPFVDLARQMVAFDRARDAWHDERDRLRQVVADMEEDLTGHRVALASAEENERAILDEATREKNAQAKVIATLNKDLGEHKETLTNQQVSLDHLERELTSEHAHAEELVAGMKKARAEAAQAIKDLEQDLAGNRAKTRALEALREEDRRGHELSEATLRQDLREHDLSLAEIGQELAAFQERCNEIEAEQARHRAATGEMRATLEGNLAEHARSLEEARADLAEHRATLRSLRKALAAEREERMRLAELSERERAEFEDVRKTLETDLAGHRETVADLHRHLASRIKNVRRALLGWKPRRKE